MIYFCIPAYNEARTVGVLLWKIRQVMAEFPRDYQILVADDASTDATPAVLEPYVRVLPLTVLRNPERRGYAASLERLLREAVRRADYPRRDVVVTLQADFTDEPNAIPDLLKRIESGADIATSTIENGAVDRPRLARWVRGAVGLVLRRYEWPGPVGDPLSGFRAYRIVCLKKAIEARERDQPLLRSDGWAANVELLETVIPYARRMEEVEIGSGTAHRDRPTRFRAWPTVRQFIGFLNQRDDDVPDVGEGLKRRRGGRRASDGGNGRHAGHGSGPAAERTGA